MAWSAAPGGKGTSAWAIAVEHALADGYPVSLARWIIFRDPTTELYKARNGLTGTIDYTSTSTADASVVINQAISATNRNEKIVLFGGGELGSETMIENPITFTNKYGIELIFDQILVNADVNGIVVNGGRDNKINGRYLYSKLGYTQNLVQLENTERNEIKIGNSYINNATGGKHIYVYAHDAKWCLCNTIWFNAIVGGVIGAHVYAVGANSWANGNLVEVRYIYNSVGPYTGCKIEKGAGAINTSGNIVQNVVFQASGDAGDVGFHVEDETNMLLNCSTVDLHANAKSIVNSSLNLQIIGGQLDPSKVTNTGTLYWRSNSWGVIQNIEHHIASDTLTKEESGTVHTNLGAGANIKLTLPQDAVAGNYFEFAVMTAGQELQIDPGAAGAIYINGAKQADDAYIWADDEAESVKLMADGNGDWIAIGMVGVWTVV